MKMQDSAKLRLESLESRTLLANSVDVIFVLDASLNMAPDFEQMGSFEWTSHAILAVEQSLSAANISETRYGVVKFGGSGAEAYDYDSGYLVPAQEASEGALLDAQFYQGGDEDGWEGIAEALSIYDQHNLAKPDAISLVLISNEGRNHDYTDEFDESDDVISRLAAENAVMNAVVGGAPSTSGTLFGQNVIGVDSKMSGGERITYNYDLTTNNGWISTGGNYIPHSGAGSNEELAQDCSNDLAHGCTFHDYIDVAWQSGGAAWEVYSFSNYFGSYVAPMTIFADSVTRQVRDQLGVQRADFDLDGDVDATDIDILTAAATQGYSRVFDLNDDAQLINGTAADSDLRYMVEVELGTAFGDANLDKKVDFADFLILTANFGEFTGWAEGDFDGDGRVLLGDFALLRLNNGFDGN